MSFKGTCPGCSKAMWEGRHPLTKRGFKTWHDECLELKEDPSKRPPRPRKPYFPTEVQVASPTWTQEGKIRAKETKDYENRLADNFGGRRLICSGASAVDTNASTMRAALGAGKGKTKSADVRVTEGPIPLLLEHKRTRAASYGVSRKTLKKVSEAARRENKDPGLVLAFQGASDISEEWVLLPLQLVQQLLEGYRES